MCRWGTQGSQAMVDPQVTGVFPIAIIGWLVGATIELELRAVGNSTGLGYPGCVLIKGDGESGLLGENLCATAAGSTASATNPTWGASRHQVPHWDIIQNVWKAQCRNMCELMNPFSWLVGADRLTGNQQRQHLGDQRTVYKARASNVSHSHGTGGCKWEPPVIIHLMNHVYRNKPTITLGVPPFASTANPSTPHCP